MNGNLIRAQFEKAAHAKSSYYFILIGEAVGVHLAWSVDSFSAYGDISQHLSQRERPHKYKVNENHCPHSSTHGVERG